MARNEEQERKNEDWIDREIRSLIIFGMESGIFKQEGLPYAYTKCAARDLNRECEKDETTRGSSKSRDREKGFHRFLLALSKSPNEGQDVSQYGKGVLFLDIDGIYKNCELYYIPIEGGGIVIVRILLKYR